MQCAKACTILFHLKAIQGGSYYLYLSDEQTEVQRVEGIFSRSKVNKYFKIQSHTYFAPACVFLVSCAYCANGRDGDQQADVLSPPSCLYMNTGLDRDCLDVRRCYFLFLDGGTFHVPASFAIRLGPCARVLANGNVQM